MAISLALLSVVIAATVCLARPNALAALILVPPWCWLLAGLASGILVWRMRQRRFALVLALWWVMFTIAWIEEVPAFVRIVLARTISSTHPEGRPLRIVSLNCASTEQCLTDLERMHPDIVLLQEAPGEDGLARFAARLFGDEGSFLGGGDTAILARGRISATFVDRSTHFVMGAVQFDDGRRFQCVSLRLAPPVARLDFWSPGFWFDHRERRVLHRRQLGGVMAQLEALPSSSAILVGGDFNTTPLDPALDELRPALIDSFRDHGRGWGATGTNDWPLFRVDQIWTNSRIVSIRTHAEKTVHSDHRLVVCDAVLLDAR